MSKKDNSHQSAKIITVRPSAETMTRQQLPYFVGISGAQEQIQCP